MFTQSKFVKASEIPAEYGISKAFAYKMEKAGKFPRRLNLNPDPDGKSVTRWLRTELDEWLENRMQSA